MLLERGVAVRQLVLGDGQDPDSFLAKSGPAALREEAERAPSLVAALVRSIPPAGSDPVERAARVGEAAAVLKAAPDRIVRYELLSALSSGTGIPLDVLIPREGKKSERKTVEKAGATAPERLPESEERVLSILLSEWPESAPLVERIPVDLFMHPTARAIFGAAKRLDPRTGALDFSELESHLEGGAGSVAARLLFVERSEASGTPGNGGEEVKGVKSDKGDRGDEGDRGQRGSRNGLKGLHKPLLQLKIRQLEERGATLQRQIQSAGESGSEKGQALHLRDQLLREKQSITAEIHRLKGELRRPVETGNWE
jgi:hypothetical protein